MRPVVLLLFVLAGCSSGVKHESRQLTCIGFCAETTVKHNTPRTACEGECPGEPPQVSEPLTPGQAKPRNPK